MTDRHKGHQVSKERIERQRIRLGLAPDQVFGRGSIFLSPQVHGVAASDGSRWSNHLAAEEREDNLKWLKLK